MELADALFGKNGYQVVFSTHLDRNHLHNHFAVNAVNPLNGKKLQTDHAFIQKMREENDRICRAHGLSVITEPKGKGKSYGEWITDKKGGFSWRGMLRGDIDDTIPMVTSVKALFDELRNIGYEIDTTGKYISLSPPGTKTFFRLHKLGQGYSLDELTERILRQPFPTYHSEPYNTRYSIKPIAVVHIRQYRYKGTFPILKHHGGFRGMYLYYLIKLRQLLKAPPLMKKRAPAQMRKDSASIRAFSEDLSLLNKHKIDTLEELMRFYSECSSDLNLSYECRQSLENKLISCENTDELKLTHQKLNAVNTTISKLKSEMRSAERIYNRSDRIRTTIQQNKAIQKGWTEDVSRSRSNRYSGENINGRG